MYLQNTRIIYSISMHDLGPNKDQGCQIEMEGLTQRQRRLIYIQVERLGQAYRLPSEIYIDGSAFFLILWARKPYQINYSCNSKHWLQSCYSDLRLQSIWLGLLDHKSKEQNKEVGTSISIYFAVSTQGPLPPFNCQG